MTCCFAADRGRYDIKMYPTFLQLHGKTFDYKIAFTSILRLFLLPHRDNRQMFFVVSYCMFFFECAKGEVLGTGVRYLRYNVMLLEYYYFIMGDGGGGHWLVRMEWRLAG